MNFVSVRCRSQLNDAQNYSNVDYKLPYWSGCYASVQLIYLFINIPAIFVCMLTLAVLMILTKYVGKVLIFYLTTAF